MSDELVERLRDHVQKQIMHPDVRATLTEAAEAIAAALREVSALREALEPFAIFGEIITADPLIDPHADDTPASILLFADGARRMLTFGDLRRAKAARALATGEKP